jgi:hypothetical protein
MKKAKSSPAVEGGNRVIVFASPKPRLRHVAPVLLHPLRW